MRIGLYPGTFDPITLGHIDIIQRAMALVDRLVIGVAINRDKGPAFSLEERVAMVEAECAPEATPDRMLLRFEFDTDGRDAVVADFARHELHRSPAHAIADDVFERIDAYGANDPR